ncbi:MAG: 4-hydroxybenzoate octaprenyltransferase [Deltaproteobacteria bacterium]|nr:4-hydroxybenzoate octaprenyltransferase [Deltaproteobacteria bacterium]
MSRATLFNDKIIAISDLIRLKKQYGTLLLLAPTMWSLFLASNGVPSVKLLVIFIFGTFLMRSAGCAINDIADRKFDRFVERTKLRPLASGRIGLRGAIFVFSMFSLLAFVLVLFLNPFTIMLSFAAIFLASLYPFVKRVSYLPQVFLGMAFGWGSVMAWSAVRNEIGIPAVTIFFANIFWSTAYDTIYALMDKDDDLKIGVKSTAILFGKQVYNITALFFLSVLILLFSLGFMLSLGIAYFMSILIAAVIFFYQIIIIRRRPDRETAFRAFVLNAVVGLIILFGIFADMLI